MEMQQIPRRVHFVGVGGIGMSGLAQHLYRAGYVVTGSDRQANDRTAQLVMSGIDVHIGHDASNIGNAQMVVRTSAVVASNPEVAAAKARGIPVILREQLLGAAFDSFGERIAVCGTHGKTTVTAMIHHILRRAGVDHAAFIGGVYNGNNYYAGGNAVVAEACEYNRGFYNLHPTCAVCLNAEFDHPDCYADVYDVRRAFAHFLNNVSADGCVILPRSLRSVAPTKPKRIFFDECFCYRNVAQYDGALECQVTDESGVVRTLRLATVGEHNILNAFAAICAVEQLGVKRGAAFEYLTDFCGVSRRWSEIDIVDLCRVVCDYAHHPTEIACSVATAYALFGGKVLCVFQPHTYSRTRALWNDFITCFDKASKVLYLPIYSAREQPYPQITSANLCAAAQKHGIDAHYASDFYAAKRWIYANAQRDGVVLLLGAGDVCNLAEMLSDNK